MDRKLESERNRLMLYSERLGGLSPLNKLGKGYVYATDQNGHPVAGVGQLTAGDRLKLRLADGSADVLVDQVEASQSAIEKKE